MFSTRLARALSVPQAQWRAVITSFLDQLGTPTQVLPPHTDPLDAEQVAWGTGAAELRCIKETDPDFVPSGGDFFAGCATKAKATSAFNKLKNAGLKVKDELQTIQEFALVGKVIKTRSILLGSFYLDQSSRALDESEAVGFIHNPNYPDKSARADGTCAWWATEPVVRALSYGLAGALSAVATAWLLRRRR